MDDIPRDAIGRSAPRRLESSRRPVLVFGQDISGASSSSNPTLQETNTMDSVRALTSLGASGASRSNNMDEDLFEYHLGDVFKYPTNRFRVASIPQQMIHQSIESRLKKHKFYVVHPVTRSMNLVDIRLGHGREYYIGHTGNDARFRAWINKKWPLDSDDLSEAEKRERSHAEWTLYRCQQAMRYLKNHPDAAIYDEPSGTIYLGFEANLNKVNEVIDRHDRSELPKLRYKGDGLHFKMSKVKKEWRRNNQSTCVPIKSMEDETSSEDQIV